jgi:PIN domain nuclease of toxin-antitoxin system
MKTINISNELHKTLVDYKKKTGISVQSLAETAIKFYLTKIQISVKEETVTED